MKLVHMPQPKDWSRKSTELGGGVKRVGETWRDPMDLFYDSPPPKKKTAVLFDERFVAARHKEGYN